MAHPSPSFRRWFILLAVALATVAAWILLGDPAPPTATSTLDDPSARMSARRAARRADPDWEEPPSTDAERSSACGSVVADDTGHAIANAMVTLRPRSRPAADAQLIPGGGRRSLLGHTDADGQWSIDGVPKVTEGAWSVTATAPGYRPLTVHVVEPCERQPTTVRLRRGGLLLHGTVRDATGGALADATVQLVPSEQLSNGAPRFAPLATNTDDDGGYRVSVEPGVYRVSVRFPDYAVERRWVRVASTTQQDFALLPGGRIEGTVVNDDGDDPVPFARVVVTQPSGLPTTGGEATAISDRNGRFVIEGMEPGEFELHAHAREGRTDSGTTIELGPGGYQHDVELRLTSAPAAYGIVVRRADNEAPVQGSTVLARSEAGTWVSKPTAEDGSFVLPALAPGEYQVSVDGSDHVPSQLAATFRVADGDVEGLVLEVDTGTTLEGRVEGGGPETSVRVEVDLEGLTPAEGMPLIGNAFASARCDVDGNFELGPITPGPVAVVAEDPIRGSGRTLLTVRADHDTPVLIELSAATGIEGRVLEGGEPREGLTVAAVRVDRPASVVPPPAKVSAGQAPVLTDADGAFRHAGLDPGTYQVQIVDASSVLAVEGDPPLVEIAAGGWSSVTIELADRSGLLLGQVVDADGAPVADAVVRATLASLSTERTLTDDNGEFELANLPTGDALQLRVTDANPGGAFVDQEARVGDEVRVQMPRGATLTVTAHGLGVGQLSLRGPRSARHALSDEGTAQFVRLPEGTYQLEARGEDGYASKELELDGSDRTVALSSEDWATVEGTLSATLGDVEGWMVFAADGDGRVRGHALQRALLGHGTRTDAEGAFSMSRVAPRPGSLTFTPPNESDAAPFTVSIAPHPGRTLDLGDVGPSE